LVWIAEQPENPGCIAEASDLGILSIKEGQGAVLLGIIESNPLLEVFLGVTKLS